jgi:hypothetical protein
MGRVISVTAESITIKPEGDLKHTYKRYHANGFTQSEEKVQDNNEPSRQFVFNDEMLYWNGTLPAAHRAKRISVSPPDGHHKISDVQPGDLVLIECRRVQGIDYCTELEIHRRPGGRVPPAWGDDKLPEEKRIDSWRNAAQYREEKAVVTMQRCLVRLFR